MNTVDPLAGAGPHPPVKVEVGRVPGAVVCSLAGDLDPDTSAEAGQALWLAVESRPGVLCVDMSGVKFCGSAGLNMLLGVRALAEHEQVPLALIAPSRPMERLLELTDAHRLFRVYPHHGMAVDDLKSPS